MGASARSSGEVDRLSSAVYRDYVFTADMGNLCRFSGHNTALPDLSTAFQASLEVNFTCPSIYPDPGRPAGHLFTFKRLAGLFTLFGLEVFQASVLGALILLLRFIALICLLNAVVMTISTSQITAALFYFFKPFEKLGFPVNDLTMVMQITLRFIPLVAQITEKTAKAQAARGGNWEQRGFNPIKQAKTDSAVDRSGDDHEP